MRILYIIFFLFILQFISYGQCTSMPSEPACSGTALADGDNVNSGTTKYSNGGTFINVAGNGGTIILCSGTTTLNTNFNFTGYIYIKTGATLNTSRGGFGTGMHIYNYGTINFTTGVALNTASAFMNASGGTMTFTGSLSGDGATFVNYGHASITNTLGNWQNSGYVCMGDGATIDAVNFNWTGLDNWVRTPVGIACLSYTGSATSGNSHTFSSTSSTNVCQKSSASNESGTGNWGTATVTQNCVSCGGVLPVDLIAFTAQCNQRNKSLVDIEWITATEFNNDYFILEQSKEGQYFEAIATIDGMGNSNQLKHYSTQISNSDIKGMFLRLKQIDFNGEEHYSRVITWQSCTNPNKIKIYNNSFVLLIDDDNTPLYGNIYDVTGRIVKSISFKNISPGTNYFELHDLASSVYVLHLFYQDQLFNSLK